MPDMNRRDFLLAGGVAAAAVLSLPVLQNSAFADAPTMPAKPIDCGAITDYDKDGAFDKFAKKPNYIFIVRKDGKIFANQAVCSHKYFGLVIKGDEFYCSKHKSEFTFEGTATAGPATKSGSLPRYGITKDDKDHVIVDCTKEFSESKWDDPASFIKV